MTNSGISQNTNQYVWAVHSFFKWKSYTIITGSLHYQLLAEDNEEDQIVFFLLNKTTRGTVSLSSDGL